MNPRPPFTFKEMCHIETRAHHVIAGIRNFVDKDTHDALVAVDYLMAEMRHAAGSLVDANAENRDEVAQRLLSIFTGTES